MLEGLWLVDGKMNRIEEVVFGYISLDVSGTDVSVGIYLGYTSYPDPNKSELSGKRDFGGGKL